LSYKHNTILKTVTTLVITAGLEKSNGFQY
jgi:hypothetical protein